MNKVFLGIFTIIMGVAVSFGQATREPKSPPVADDRGRGRQVTLASGTAISGELQKTIDVNNAKVGDQVNLKTTQAIRQNGEVVIPRGSNLIGRVTDVQRRTRENAQSRIAMVFDQIEGKQLSVPVSATLVSITNVAGRAQADDLLTADAAGSSQTSASTTRSSSGGGLLGGVTSTAGGVLGTTTQTLGTVTNTAGQTVGATTQTAARTLGGIQILADASGSSTTTLSSNKNLRIEKGATFHLRIAN